MTPFKSSWSRTSFGVATLAIVAACATISWDQDVLPYTVFQAYSPNASAFGHDYSGDKLYQNINSQSDDREGKEKVSIDPDGDKAARAIFKAYCRSGRQRRNLTLPVRVLIPKVGPGLSLTNSAALDSHYRDAAKKTAASLYERLAYPKKGREVDEASFVHGDDKAASLLAAESNRPEAISPPPDRESREINDRRYVMFDRDPISLLTYKHDKRLYLLFAGVDSLLVSTSDRKASASDLSGKEIVFGRVTDHTIRATREGTKTDLYSIQPLVLAEAYYLTNYYTFVLQNGGGPEMAEVARGLIGGTKFDIDEATGSRRFYAWREYFKKFTSYKEAQSKDPKVIDYDVSLDLNALCTYGRPISDLLSK